MTETKDFAALWDTVVQGWLTFDWAGLWQLLANNALPFEVFALVLGSALIGFLAGRWFYRGAARDNQELLRRESAIWRRKIANGRVTASTLIHQRDRAARKLRRASPRNAAA